ncbi:MAG: MFS transporter [Bacteroides sp. SM23_62_1]|nr:MAG: MFS transporter [Bacteroides sp. SM23_62_1]
MLKGHPRGLLVAFFANMGERFGYYTMLAIFVLFLQAKYGFEYRIASQYFGIFLAFVYFMPFFGGIIADRWLGYGKTISLGLIVMFIGYLLIAIPTSMDGGLPLVITGLAVISTGTGFFKGNLQALVGNLYDDPRYSEKRDVAFNIFYMGINIGAMFAPTAAQSVYNLFLKRFNLFYRADIPALAHRYLNGDFSIAERLQGFAEAQPAFASLNNNLEEFSRYYINNLAESYHWAFGVACLSLIASMIIFWGFRKYYKHADLTEKEKSRSDEHRDKMIILTTQQTKQRLIALGLVFFVVIFFWMAFHQNGAAMTAFARDYTVDRVVKYTNIWFDLFGLLPIFLAVISLYFVFRKGSSRQSRILGGLLFIAFVILALLRIEGLGFFGFENVNPESFFAGYSLTNEFTPEKFQHFNPFFIVALTPIIVGIFNWLRIKGREPSAPKKIGIGMIITAGGFIFLVIGSLSLIGFSPEALNETRATADVVVGPYWLISTYFTLTIAELFLSPMGISFVSKVSPPQYKGMMQGGWLAATAIGNYGVALVGWFWNKVELWIFWGILVVFCLLAAAFIFSVLKRLEKAASS